MTTFGIDESFLYEDDQDLKEIALFCESLCQQSQENLSSGTPNSRVVNEPPPKHLFHHVTYRDPTICAKWHLTMEGPDKCYSTKNTI